MIHCSGIIPHRIKAAAVDDGHHNQEKNPTKKEYSVLLLMLSNETKPQTVQETVMAANCMQKMA
jgi:hypothetical protein